MIPKPNAPATPEGLELYRLRDDFSCVYNPANPVEQMFVSQIAITWQRLTRAQAAERRYFASNDLLTAITKNAREYKDITRYVAACERAWRHAVCHLERIQRLRRKTDLSSPNARRSWHPAPEKIDYSLYIPAKDAETKPEATKPG